jgi:hypothetical protein
VQAVVNVYVEDTRELPVTAQLDKHAFAERESYEIEWLLDGGAVLHELLVVRDRGSVFNCLTKRGPFRFPPALANACLKSLPLLLRC